MTLNDPKHLQRLTHFDNLLDYLRDELSWPIEVDELSEAVFRYSPEELNINPRYAARITAIKQLRPLVNDQVWGIFFVEFDHNRLPVMALRRILQGLAASRRQQSASLPAWNRQDLLFICVYTSATEEKSGQRGICFAHFHDVPNHQPELRTFSWDSRETHFYYIKNLNLNALRWPSDDRNADAWRQQWRGAFTVRHQYVIHTAEKLASQMAKQAVIIRELVTDLYEAEGEKGALHSLYERLRVDLIHDLQPDDFADMIAQTITYGVFSAAVQSGTIELEHLPTFIPDTNQFLQRMLETLITDGGLDLDELGVGELVELLRQADLKAITRDFGRQAASGSEDPVVHFYEKFLNEYDSQQRVERGVFYTPDPVVSYIVRAVDQILRRPTEEGGFGIVDGLASDATTEKGEPLVQILDPATGTGTFLAHIIDHIATRKNPRGQTNEDWNRYVAHNLLKRLNGFELMMAPYTIAHLKLGLKLAQTGYSFGTGERLRVFLTNTLEKPTSLSDVLLETDYLSREANEANVVKRSKPIMVVLGNPPYSGHSANKNIEDWFKLNDYYFVDGKPLGERNPKWLQDDYVKFIRFGQWQIQRNGRGILAFITNHGYLDNPTFRGMRQALLNTFDDIYIVDLHGNSKKKERAPDGGKDENVFDIQQGVSIGIFVKHSDAKTPARVHHLHLYGTRTAKYQALRTGSIADEQLKDSGWRSFTPEGPFYLFMPQNLNLAEEYQSGWKIADAMPINSVGIVTGQDNNAIAISLKDTQELAAKARIDIAKIKPLLYRPFDNKHVVYDSRLVTRTRFDVMQHMLKNNIGLITVRQVAEGVFNHVFTSNKIVESRITLSNKGIGYLYPLYSYPSTHERFDDGERDWKRTNGRQPNLSRDFIGAVQRRLRITFTTDGRGDLKKDFGPEDIFQYAYAVFHSPTYRERYAEFLKIDFPRLPLTDDIDLFRELVALGTDLVALHLLEDDYQGASWAEHSPLKQPITRFVSGSNGSTVGTMSKGSAYNAQLKRIYLDTSALKNSSYFEFNDDISTEEALATWEFQIGGYQVLHKWLYDRRGKPGRTLTKDDVAHYQRVVVALYQTRRLMADIDTVIEARGGFPLPGSVPAEDAE